MTSPSTAESVPAPRTYRSPLHALVWSFRKSRDNWKRKYLKVKADLRRVHRRLDRLAKANRPSLSRAALSPAPSTNYAPSAVVPPAGIAVPEEPQSSPHPAAASDAILPSFIAFLHQAVLDLRQQVQANREILEQTEKQNAAVRDLVRQMQQLASGSPPLAPPPAPPPPPPVPPSPSSFAQARQSLYEVSYQAPSEPKKGVPRQYRR
jgi:hypothetical protein